MTETWTPPDPPKARAEREYAALFRIHERHADSPTRRARPGRTTMIGPVEAIRLLVSLAAGSSVVEDGEDDVDTADLTAALTLMARARVEIDELEASLLIIARGQGMTWQELAFWLGLGSAQAARQRYERLARRTAPADPKRGHEEPLRRRIADVAWGEFLQEGPRAVIAVRGCFWRLPRPNPPEHVRRCPDGCGELRFCDLRSLQHRDQRYGGGWLDGEQDADVAV